MIDHPGIRRLIDFSLVWLTILLFGLALLGVALFAGQAERGGTTVLRIVAPALPPQMNAHGGGREAEIITAALRAGGFDGIIYFHTLPFTRHWQRFDQDERFGAVATVPLDLDLEGAAPSATYIRYQNGAIYRVTSFPEGIGDNPKAAIDAMAGERVVAFAGASRILAPIGRVSRSAARYLEREDQLSHSEMFKADVVDFVVADQLIFTYYTREVFGPVDYPKIRGQLRFDPIFCPTPYRMMFRDYRIRDQFDRGLALITARGELGLINQKYLLAADIPVVPRRLEGC